jgi:hypothetical protein
MLGETALAVDRGEVDALGPAHALIRPERVRIEPYGHDGQVGPNRVPAMVERLVFLGASTQVMLRLAPGALLQAVVPNDGTEATLSQGTPVHVFLAPDVLRVLGGATRDVPVAPVTVPRPADAAPGGASPSTRTTTIPASSGRCGPTTTGFQAT